MLRNSFAKPLLVLSVLVLAALACYSDSTLWPYDLTEPAPSPTFIPTPGPDSPAKFGVGDLVIAPRKATNPQPFLFLADHPEPVTSTLSNSSGNCLFDEELAVLYAGHRSDTEIYYLVACKGTVGWILEENIEGPIEIRKGQSAFTLPIDANGNPINNDIFGIHNSQPPVFGPATVQCQVGEDVSVSAISIPEQDQIWYQVRCSGGSGWVNGTRLFGPLVLPGNNGIGLVSPDVESITLTTAPGGGEVVGECQGDSIIETQDLELVDETAYYHITCNDQDGWTTQESLVQLPFLPNTLLIIEVPQTEAEVVEGDTAVADDAEATVDETDGETSVLTAPVTENPANPSDENPVVVECPTLSIVPILDVTFRNSQFFYQVTCDDQTGWLNELYTKVTADFAPDEIVAITEAGVVGSGSEAGFYVSEEPQTVAGPRGTIGACELNTQATINDYAYLDQAGFLRVYYQITCRNRETGEDLLGWALQSRLRPADAISGGDSATPTEIFGG